MKIFVATHKKFSLLPKEEIYEPLHVGAWNKADLGYLKDDSNDNISNKNANYCELTGWYWIWKNSKEDIIGTAHYRRFFVTRKGFLNKILTGKNTGFLTKNEISEILKTSDIVVSTKGRSIGMKNLINAYGCSHNKKDIIETRNVISDIFPEYLATFDYIFSKVIFYPANMMICKKETFDAYCSWLFPILFELEKRIDISNYSDYQKRVFGFISERIFRVWLVHNNLKLKEMHIINTEDKSMFNIGKNEFIRMIHIWTKKKK